MCATNSVLLGIPLSVSFRRCPREMCRFILGPVLGSDDELSSDSPDLRSSETAGNWVSLRACPVPTPPGVIRAARTLEF